MNKQEIKITLYTQSECNPCKSIVKWLDRKELYYHVVNLDEDNNRDIAKELGVTITPSAMINGVLFSGRDEIKPHLTRLL